MIRISRAELLRALQTVEPGISKQDTLEQSSCFVFQNGEVVTFNEETSCRMPTPLGDEITGAVTAEPLLKLLGKLKDEEIGVEIRKGQFCITGKRKRARLRTEAEITLPIDVVEQPGDDWQPLHEQFAEAIGLVKECASKDQSKFAITCIHVTPQWIEATDNMQMTRFKIDTGVAEPCLIRKNAIKHITTLEMSEFCETETWIHFRNASGLVMSCRRYLEDYKDLKPLFKFKGEPLQLPKGLADITELAEIFSSEDKDNNQLDIHLEPGSLRIKGVGSSGEYMEQRRVKYNGPSLDFRIGPEMLRELSNKYHECEISENRLKVKGGSWVFVTCLGLPPERQSDSEKEK